MQLRYVASIPGQLKPVIRQRGRLILATGTSGHDHYIDDPRTEMGEDKEGTRHLKIMGETMKGRWPIIEHTELHVLVQHPQIGELAFAEADIVIKGKSAIVDGYFAVLHHDSKPLEHSPQALPRGNAVQMDQSEYNLEEIRRVTD